MRRLYDGITDWRACGILIVAVIASMVDVIVGGRSFFIRDLSRFYHPTKRILREILLSGEFPWWNPYYAAGQPLAANPEYAAFYPPQWLILIPDFELGFRLHIVFHLIAAAIGMYLLLRFLRVGRGASLAGGLSWGMGGLAMSLVNLLPILFCATWIPFLIRYLGRFVRYGHRRDWALATLFGGLQLLAAEPVTLIQTWLLASAWTGWFLWRRRHLLPTASQGILAGRSLMVLGGSLLLGGVQLWPAIIHVADTVRADGFTYDLVVSWSLHPMRPLEMLLPAVFGRFSQDGQVLYWGGAHFYSRQASPFIFSIAPGIALSLMAGAGVLARSRGWIRFVLTGGVFYLLALGGHTPLYHWLWSAGIARGFRYPEKFTIGLVFVTIIFASVMLDRLHRGDDRLQRVSRRLAFSAAILVGAGLALSLLPGYPSTFGKLWGISSSRFLNQMAEGAREATMVQLILWLAVAGILAVPRRTTLGWMLVLIWAELSLFSLDVSPRVDSDYYRAPPLAAQLDPHREGWRIFHEVDWYGRSNTARSWFSTGDAVYWVVRNGMFPMTPGNELYRTVLERDYDKTAMTHSVDLVKVMFAVRDRGRADWARIFMGMSNARYRARYRAEAAELGPDEREVDPITFVEVAATARYRLVSDVRRFGDLEEMIDMIVERGSGSETAWISSEVEGPIAGSSGDVTVIEERHSMVRLSVEAESSGLLYASITNHDNWIVTIDGREVNHFPVNIGFMGFEVPAGRSEVILRYFDPVVAGSAGASLVMLLLVIVAFLPGSGRRIPSRAGV